MKCIWRILLSIACIGFLTYGCEAKDTTETITDRNIPVTDVMDFYYTYENINYNAFYQRYRFYVEDGKYMFHHETREIPDGYGWTTEEDITKEGTFALKEKELQEFWTLLKNGEVSARSDSTETGDAGPWMYIYWKGDKGKYQVFDFPSYEARVDFEQFCEQLSNSRGN